MTCKPADDQVGFRRNTEEYQPTKDYIQYLVDEEICLFIFLEYIHNYTQFIKEVGLDHKIDSTAPG